MPIDLHKINKDWTLFLDRDGVINHEKNNDYIHTWNEFKFYNGVLQAFPIFSSIFKYVIIVTNQRGIGKGVTKLEDVELIHENMKLEIEASGGKVDAVYFCPDIDNDSPCRKPNIGMGLHAIKEFPLINLHKSIMVGNTISDMQFGRNLGVKNIFLPTTRPEVQLTDDRIDMACNSLIEFAILLKEELLTDI